MSIFTNISVILLVKSVKPDIDSFSEKTFSKNFSKWKIQILGLMTLFRTLILKLRT